jgi:hypothetical protein
MKILCIDTELPTIDARFIYTFSTHLVAFYVYQTSNSEVIKDIEININMNIKQFEKIKCK